MKKQSFSKISISFILIMAMICSIMPGAHAAGTVAVTMSSASGLPGSNVALTITTNSAGTSVGCGEVKLSYDTTILEIVSIVPGAAAGGIVTVKTDIAADKAGLNWALTSGGMVLDGVMGTFNFKIKSTATAGSVANFNIYTADFYDAGNDVMTVTKTPGTVTVQSNNSVTYNANGAGSGLPPTDGLTYLSGTNITVAGNTGSLAKTGYTFNGWRDNSAGTGTLYAANSTYISQYANITFYADWLINNYNVTYNSQGGSGVAPATANYGSTITKPTDPTKPGFTFVNWYKEAACTNVWNFSTDTVTDATTLYAKWTGNTYLVTFDANSGVLVGDSSQTKMFGAAYGKDADGTTAKVMPTATRGGYNFGGWYTAASGGTLVTDATTVATASAHTLFARWTGNPYVITFSPEGGSVSPTSQTKLFGATYGNGIDGISAELMPTPTRTGYTFGGWFTAVNGGGTQILDTTTVAITAAQTLYAKWTITQSTITFNSNSGSAVTAITQDYNTSVTKPADPTRTGYTFAGWYSDSGLTTAVTWPHTMGASNVTFYAKWTITQHTITFNSNSGSAVTAITQDYNTSAVKPTDPTRAGYTFAGWYTDSGLTTATSWPITMTSNITLYAKWTANTYTVTFKYQDSTTADTTASPTYASAYGTLPTPTRTGYTFAGWFTAATGGTQVTAATTVTTASAHNLYAQWTINSYTVTFDGNTSTGGTAPSALTIQYQASGVVSGNTGNLVKTGNVFIGWNTAADGNSTNYWPGMSYTIGAANAILYANWTTSTTYTVTYDTNGSTSGTAPAYVNNYKNGDTVTVLDNTGSLAKTGSTFSGWNTKADGSGTAYTAGSTFPMGSENVVLYAKWTTQITGGSGTTLIASGTINASDTEKIVNKIKGTASNIEASMTGTSTLISAEVFSALKGQDKKLTINATDYKWIANGKEITNPTAFSKYDLGIKFWWQLKKEIKTIPAGILEPKLVVEFSINHNGTLPGKMYLEFSSSLSGDKNRYNGKTLYFYSKNETTGKPEYISPVTVGGDGTVTLPFTHASTYLLTETMILTDVEDHWAYRNIMDMVGTGVINGNGSGLFEPDKGITRAEFAKMIATAYGYKSTSTVTQFSDVTANDWYSEYVSAMYQNRIMTGMTSSTFEPQDTLTREQMTTVLYRVLKSKGYAFTVTTSISFNDQSQIYSYASEAVATMTSSGIVNGMEGNCFNPKSAATKAQVATILSRTIGLVK